MPCPRDSDRAAGQLFYLDAAIIACLCGLLCLSLLLIWDCVFHGSADESEEAEDELEGGGAASGAVKGTTGAGLPAPAPKGLPVDAASGPSAADHQFVHTVYSGKGDGGSKLKGLLMSPSAVVRGPPPVAAGWMSNPMIAAPGRARQSEPSESLTRPLLS